MTQTSTPKYDPFQATLVTQFSSGVHDFVKEKADNAQETVRPYKELYWYGQGPSKAYIENLKAPRVVPTTTAFSDIPSMSGSMSIVGNLAVASLPPVTPSVYIRKSIYSEPQSRFEVLQKWEGVVLEVLSDSFTARLSDLTRQGPDEDAEFALEEIDIGDRDLLRPGAVFYWNIGYSDSLTGRARVSIIRFRRLPIWRRDELEKAKRDAERLSNLIDWK
jgi:hypothetical protein